MDIEIEIVKDDVKDDGSVYQGCGKTKIKVPIRWWSASEHRGFSLYKNGKGSYLGTSQMFGGPQGGELVCFEGKINAPLIAIMTGMTQDWDTRKGSLEFVCLKKDFWDRVKTGLIVKGIEKPELQDEIFKHSNQIFGFEKAVDMQFEIAKYNVSKFILTQR